MGGRGHGGGIGCLVLDVLTNLGFDASGEGLVLVHTHIQNADGRIRQELLVVFRQPGLQAVLELGQMGDVLLEVLAELDAVKGMAVQFFDGVMALEWVPMKLSYVSSLSLGSRSRMASTSRSRTVHCD